MKNYLELMEKILSNGSFREDRTGVGTYALFGERLEWDLSEGFPLLTTKKMFFRGVFEELLFFLQGKTNTKILEKKGVHIWKGNTSASALTKRGLTHHPEGEMGKGYGFQWVNWGGTYEIRYGQVYRESNGINQIEALLEGLKKKPTSRNHIVSAWNVADLPEMALDPCHMLFQCFVDQGSLSLMWTQRSCDFFLGVPFNVASYAALTHILAQCCGLKPGRLIFSGGDVHLYKNHIDAVKAQLYREPHPLPQFEITKDISSYEDIYNLSFEDFVVHNYKYHPAIKAEMAV